MAVPKKRKKMDDTMEDLIITEPSALQQKDLTSEIREPKRPAKTAHKLDNAFEIIESMRLDGEDDHEDVYEDVLPRKKKSAVKADLTASRVQEGIRVELTLDVLTPKEKVRQEDGHTGKDSKSPLYEVGFTVPFLWDLPILGPAAQTLLQHLKKK